MESNQIMVSICCLAYNHEPYIRKCLDGFIMQKTNFKYEVLIHDDASTDQTANIIREYESKYPDIIKPIYQTENQHSKGVAISRKFQYPRAKGKYIAFCEGDDYWTDDNKLQKQVDFLEKNPEYSICVHQATLHNCTNGTDSIVTNQLTDKEYSLEEVVFGQGGLFATNSIVMLKENCIQMPECFKAKGFGDFQLVIYSTIIGKCYYLSDNMSVYNYQSIGSWTARFSNNQSFHIEHLKNLIQLLNSINNYYNLKYNEIFGKYVLEKEYELYLYSGNILKIHSNVYREYYLNDLNNGLSPNKQCIVNRFPKLCRVYFKLKGRLLNGKK